MYRKTNRFTQEHAFENVFYKNGCHFVQVECVDHGMMDQTHPKAWWRHQMETIPALLAICAGNSRSPVNSPHKGQWRGALMFSLIYAWINSWVNKGEAGDLRHHRAHYDVTVMASPERGMPTASIPVTKYLIHPRLTLVTEMPELHLICYDITCRLIL